MVSWMMAQMVLMRHLRVQARAMRMVARRAIGIIRIQPRRVWMSVQRHSRGGHMWKMEGVGDELIACVEFE